jgi:hypothetical protein
MSDHPMLPVVRGALVEVYRRADVLADGQARVFRTPIGAYFSATREDFEVSLDGIVVDSGIGPMHATDQPASVVDVSSGVRFDVPPPAGSVVRICWIERSMPIAPRTVAAVRLAGDPRVLDVGTSWKTSSDATTPNGIIVPPPPEGFVVELWRYGRRAGGKSRERGIDGRIFTSAGRRLMPYWRGPQEGTLDPATVQIVDGPGFGTWRSRKTRYRVCYYSPSLRVRTNFAPGLVTVFGAVDWHNGDATAVRMIGTVYVDPS